MLRRTGLLALVPFLCSCSRGKDALTPQELSKLLGMHTFTAHVSLRQGEVLYLGTFTPEGPQRTFVGFPAEKSLGNARIVLGYWKPDKGPEANYGYIVPSGDSGTNTLTVPQPYTGVTAHPNGYKVGERVAFLKFEGADVYLGYWITPNPGAARDGGGR